MALVKCSECGKEISDKATTCPNCGNPIQAIRNAQIDQQNREYYKKYNREQLIFNIFTFCVAIALGYTFLHGDYQFWALISVFATTGIFLLLSVTWVQYVVAIIFLTQKYKHIPKWIKIVTFCLGYTIGGIIGMRT